MKVTQAAFLLLLGSVLNAEGLQWLQEGAVQMVEPAADCINCDGTPLESSADMSLPPRRARSLDAVPLSRKKRGIIIMDIDSGSDGEEIPVPLIYKKRSENKLIPMQYLQKMPKTTKLIGVIEPEAVRYSLEQPDVVNEEEPRKKQPMLMVLLPTTRTVSWVPKYKSSNVGSRPSPRIFGIGRKLFGRDKNLALTFDGKGSMEVEGGINVDLGRGRGSPWCNEVSSRFGVGEAGLAETLGSKVGGNIGRSIGRGVGGGVGAGIGRSIGGKVGGNLGESLLGCVGSDIGTSIGQGIGEGIGRTVGSSIGGGIGEGIGEKVGGGFGRAIDKMSKKYAGKIGRGEDGISEDSLGNSESELDGDEESAELDNAESDNADDAGEDTTVSNRSGFRGARGDSLGYRSGLNDDQFDRTGSRVAGRQFSPRIFGIGRKVICHLASKLDCERRDQHNTLNGGSVNQNGPPIGGGGGGGGHIGGGGGGGGGQIGGGGGGGGQIGGGGGGSGRFESQIEGNGGGGNTNDCCDCNDPKRLCKARGCCDCYYRGGVRICGKFRGEGSFAGKGNLGSLGKFDGQGRVRGEGQLDAAYLGNGQFGGKGKFGGDGEFSGQISLG